MNEMKRIAVERLFEHPESVNVQSRVTFAKLVRHIERTGLYEPLVVRPLRGKDECYQVINGHHRLKALEQLGYRECDCIIWDVNDDVTDMLLLTLNRLGGRDRLDKKLRALRRLNNKFGSKELGKLLVQNAKQIERLVNFKKPQVTLKKSKTPFAEAEVFFVDGEQQRVVEQALSLAAEKKEAPRAARRGAALAAMAEFYIHQKAKRKR